MNTIALSRWQFFTALAVLAVSGLLGGALATWLLPGRAAWAQEADERTPGVVRAKAFELVDDAGATRATLAFDAEGRLDLLLSGAAGKIQAELGVLADGESFLGLRDAEGNVRAALGVLADGQPFLALRDAEDNMRVTLGVLADGQPYLVLWDADGRPLFSAPK